MKTSKITLIIVILLVSIKNNNSQLKLVDEHDHLFSKGGKSMVTLATGIPYIGIAEYSYGFSDKFSAGVIVGTTPVVPGYGVRFRGVIYQPSETFRVYARVPAFYYPSTKELGGEPWLLTWPVLNAEWKLKSGVRLSVGTGIVVAACLHSLLGHSDEGEGFMGGVWNTFQTGIAVPLSRKIMFQAEVSAVFSGLKIAKKNDWVGGPPFILVTGISYHF